MEKIVYLKRTAPFVHDQITSEEMQAQLAMTKKSIGSYFASENSSRIGTGLQPDEEKFLISQLKGIEFGDPKLSIEIEKFYSDIVTNVPGGKKGLELNIGLQSGEVLIEKDENGKVIKYNLPEKIMDYIRYRHALGFKPYVAATAQLAAGNPLVEFYIEDPDVTLAARAKEADIKDNAMTEYLKIKDNNDSVNMLLSLLRANIKKEQGVAPVNPSRMIDPKFLKQKQILLREIVLMRPERFYNVATDKNIKKRYFIDELMSHGIFIKTGNIIMDTSDSNRPLGSTVEELLVNLWESKESQTLTRLKAELQIKQNGKVLL